MNVEILTGAVERRHGTYNTTVFNDCVTYCGCYGVSESRSRVNI